jgi:quinol-cytochrome oxidoreductase complex cytochrome b subunit
MMTPKPDAGGLPIRPGHVLYPMLALYALVGLLFGPAGREATDDMPENKTHPYFPDHLWPYPILGTAVLVTLGLLAVLAQPLLQLGQAADPRVSVIPRPEWYFLSLFQFVKLGPALLTSILIPAALVVGLVFWPLLDARLGPGVARRLGWHTWPIPKRNAITGTIWIAGLWIIGLLTLWTVVAPQLCLPWFYNGPICGG